MTSTKTNLFLWLRAAFKSFSRFSGFKVSDIIDYINKHSNERIRLSLGDDLDFLSPQNIIKNFSTLWLVIGKKKYFTENTFSHDFNFDYISTVDSRASVYYGKSNLEQGSLPNERVKFAILPQVKSFNLSGNHETTGTTAATFYAVTATLAATTDLDPLADAINKHAANTGVTAKLGATAAELILTHQTGETITLRDIKVAGGTTKNLSLSALDKFGNDHNTADTTLNRLENTGDEKFTTGTDHAAKRHGYVLGTVTLSSIKNFTVAGDHADQNKGYFESGLGSGAAADGYTGQTAAGGTAKLSSVASISVADQEHATDAIAVLDSAIAKIDQQRADLGAISNRLSSVVDNNTSMVTNTESSKSHILDTDFAVETTKLTRTQILQQAATSMLAQANASKQSVLALLQNLG